MEEISDAVQDARYVHDVSCVDKGPKPVSAWTIPTEEELKTWKETKVASLLSASAFVGISTFGRADSFVSRSSATSSALSFDLDAAAEADEGSEDEDEDDDGDGVSLGRVKEEEEEDEGGANETLLESIDYVCSQPLGFFLFSQYLKDERNDFVRVNFIEDVIKYRRIRDVATRREAMRMIQLTYLTEPAKNPEGAAGTSQANGERDYATVSSSSLSTKKSKSKKSKAKEKAKAAAVESSTTTQTNSTNSCIVLPPKKEIVDNDLYRPIPLPASFRSTMTASLARVMTSKTFEEEDEKHKKNIAAMVAANHDSTYSKCIVGVNGPVLNKCLSVVKEFEKENSGVEQAGGVENPPPFHVFDDVEMIVMEGLRKEYWSLFLKSDLYRKLLNFWWFRDRTVVLEDFTMMRILGRGGYGLVHACKKDTSGKFYAIKAMSKRRIKTKRAERLVLNERKALAAVDSPFLVKLFYSFQSKDDLFLVLDLMTGGDLGFHLSRKRRFNRTESLYFAARIMLGLQALHDRRFVYRDLKPHNVLVADDGRVKLSDLGLTTRVTPQLRGPAGTRGYWAPEMLRKDARGRRTRYGHPVDWFSFGCCITEFISGQCPFRNEEAMRFGLRNGMTTKETAIDCATLDMDPTLNPELFDDISTDLCRRLLDKDEKKRLGSHGCNEIMAHPWFQGFDWKEASNDRMEPPFRPAKDVNTAAAGSVSIMDSTEQSLYSDAVLGKREDQIYKLWDWTNPNAFDAEVIEFLIHERKRGTPLLPSEHNSACCIVL